MTRRGLDSTIVPRATYRLQLNGGFGFDAAAAIVPYVAALGVSHVYASPVLTARPGSTHGYDVVDCETINPELGGEGAFLRFSDTLRAYELGLVLDIVPNHMGVGGAGNRWWQSVLKWGRTSPHARAFDIDWERPDAGHKLVLPILGSPYGQSLEKGELTLRFDAKAGSFAIHCGEHVLPLSPPTYGAILGRAASAGGHALSQLAHHAGRGADVERGEALECELARLAERDPLVLASIEEAVRALNGRPGDASSFDGLDVLISRQHWRASYWRVASSDINYRRFFDINLLAGIRVEDPGVFDATHRVTLRLVAEGRVQGLRIDHIDGLADPLAYLERLRKAVGPEPYLVVEKILEPGEGLRAWPIAGTTGYDVLSIVDNVLLDPDGKDEVLRLHAAAGGGRDYQGELADAKCLILEGSFAGELEGLVGDLKLIADQDRGARDLTRSALRAALAEIFIAFPVYRSYLDNEPATAADRDLVRRAIEAAKTTSRLDDVDEHDFIGGALLEGRDGAVAAEAARFRRRFQQLTGPVMAKSLEDTLFYRYVPLIALNEVGGDPGRFGMALDAFHTAMARRAEDWPLAMIATATHDTKRGEDGRARLLALGNDPPAFGELVALFEKASPPFLTRSEHGLAPDGVDRLLLLQSLLGAFPLGLLGEARDRQALDDFRERIRAFAVKALREAKRHTSWVKPNADYEAAAQHWLDQMLSFEAGHWHAFAGHAARLAFLGMLNSLSRTVLKFTLPGVPDLFQGTELWDFSLVDPDNRGPVDYEARLAALEDGRDAAELLTDWRSGAVKQRLTRLLLADRASSPKLYAKGDYAPLAIAGERQANVLAFMRRHGTQRLVTLGTRFHGRLDSGRLPVGEIWGGTRLKGLPPGRWRDVLTGRDIEARGEIGLDRAFAVQPVAVLREADDDA